MVSDWVSFFTAWVAVFSCLVQVCVFFIVVWDLVLGLLVDLGFFEIGSCFVEGDVISVCGLQLMKALIW